MYSYADIILMLVAFKADLHTIISCSLLWFGFLIHLEWRHRDNGRLYWPTWTWIILWVVGVLIHPSVFQIPFIVTCISYSLKKRFKYIGLISWIINGSIKVWMVAMIPAPTWGILVVGILMSIRNLAGDIRDAGKDYREGAYTLPVVLGLRKNIPYIYPAFLVITSLVWFYIGSVSWYWLLIVFIIQITTYHLTPR